MALRRLQLQDSTPAQFQIGLPSGPIPVIEIDDATGQIYAAGKSINVGGGSTLSPPLNSVQFNNNGALGGSSQLLWTQSGFQVGTGDHSILFTASTTSTVEITPYDGVFGAAG